mmetsp:Transcript_65359/g.181752  ORF Transcript_65359/g.181752 Transcript_65359/m.181752 type:complete len:895 (+) Transcript_65359:64-2748(+)
MLFSGVANQRYDLGTPPQRPDSASRFESSSAGNTQRPSISVPPAARFYEAGPVDIVFDLLADLVAAHDDALCKEVLRVIRGTGGMRDGGDMRELLTCILEAERPEGTAGWKDGVTEAPAQNEGLRKIENSLRLMDMGYCPLSVDVVSDAAIITSSCSESGENAKTWEAGSAERKQENRLPYLPDASYGGPLQRCFALFEDVGSSVLAKVIAALITFTIVVSTISFVLESMPELRERPQECADLAAAGLPSTIKACEPRPHSAFRVLEAVCIAIFTVDYVVRVVLVHTRDGPHSLGEGLRRTARYTLQPLNIIDVLAVLPFYLDIMLGGQDIGSIRVLRLLRVLRLIKVAKYQNGINMFTEVLVLSGQPLLVLMFFNMIITVLFASVVYFIEGQSFSVAVDFTGVEVDPVTNVTVATGPFPTGVYVRKAADMETMEVTPFHSIPYAVWWVCVTMTTVGYGDYAPTTPLGKIVGVVAFYAGILFLALPIQVLGSNFEIVYAREHPPDPSADAKRALARNVRLEKLRIVQKESKGLFPSSGCFRRRVFLTLEEPSASLVGKVLSFVLLATILVSTVAFILETMPGFNYTDAACTPSNLTVEACTPRPHKSFYAIEVVCIIIFTIDYVTRACTVHAASLDDCRLQPPQDGKPMNPVLQTLLYCSQWLNLIDFLAIVPFYVERAGLGGGGAGVLRVLRLVRMFRVMKMPRLQRCVDMFISVIVESLPALFLLFFMSMVGCVFFAALAWFCEGTNYVINEEYPAGAYLRPSFDGYTMEVSPFRSVLTASWWFFTTATTVGYGDEFPTTTWGRIVAVVAFYVGIILLALPVGIVGGAFGRHYPSFCDELEMMKREEQAMSEEWRLSTPLSGLGISRKIAPESDTPSTDGPANDPPVSEAWR